MSGNSNQLQRSVSVFLMMRSVVLLLLVTALGVGSLQAEARSIRAFVALCDNDSQGIAPVPPRIGNGDDPAERRNVRQAGALIAVPECPGGHEDPVRELDPVRAHMSRPGSTRRR